MQVKEPYGNFDMVTCRLSSCNRSVLSTPADNTRKRVWQYIEKERDVMQSNFFFPRGQVLVFMVFIKD